MVLSIHISPRRTDPRISTVGQNAPAEPSDPEKNSHGATSCHKYMSRVQALTASSENNARGPGRTHPEEQGLSDGPGTTRKQPRCEHLRRCKRELDGSAGTLGGISWIRPFSPDTTLLWSSLCGPNGMLSVTSSASRTGLVHLLHTALLLYVCTSSAIIIIIHEHILEPG